jgi:protease I
MFEKIEQFFTKKEEVFLDHSIKELSGCFVAILATDGFEQSELFEPLSALEGAGASVKIVSLAPGKIKAWNKSDWGKSIEVDMTVLDAFTEDFDFLMLPGGVINPDKLRIDDNVVAFVQSFVNKGKPIAAICHGPQTLIETGMVKGRTMTSWPSLKTDLTNAGAKWVDKEVAIDKNLVTSRKPADIPAFNKAMIQLFVDYHNRNILPNTEGYVATL